VTCNRNDDDQEERQRGEGHPRYSPTRRRYSAEENIRIVLEGLRGESSIAELCRKEGINQRYFQVNF
jgi:transposase-like protein